MEGGVQCVLVRQELKVVGAALPTPELTPTTESGVHMEVDVVLDSDVRRPSHSSYSFICVDTRAGTDARLVIV